MGADLSCAVAKRASKIAIRYHVSRGVSEGRFVPPTGHSGLTGWIPKAVIRLGGNSKTGFGTFPTFASDMSNDSSCQMPTFNVRQSASQKDRA